LCSINFYLEPIIYFYFYRKYKYTKYKFKTWLKFITSPLVDNLKRRSSKEIWSLQLPLPLIGDIMSGAVDAFRLGNLVVSINLQSRGGMCHSW